MLMIHVLMFRLDVDLNVHLSCIAMSKSCKQTTLFQSWGGTNSTTKTTYKPDTNAAAPSNQDSVIWIDEDEAIDDLLLTIPLEDDSTNHELQTSRGNVCHADINKTSTAQQARLTYHRTFSESKGTAHISTRSLFTAVACSSHLTDKELQDHSQPMPDCSGLPGFDPHAGRLWIYPTNYPVRDYQFNIVQSALFKNTLVALPTGLGKTFIAAVVMYNLYRWYPQGKVVFMAPTKPLVAQQIEACYNIMGIPEDDTAEMTGAMHRGKRSKAWQLKRVFYLTPQVLMNDISSGTCPARLVRCLVVDEAHKAIGNHAYCQVVKELAKYKVSMRILALSATPGTDIKAVQEVLNNLLISHIELRTEQSPDIQPYTHERKVEKVIVPLGEELGAVKGKYLEIVEVVVNRLKRHGVLYQRNVDKLSKFLLLKAREAFRQNPPENMQRFTYGAVEGDFALCLSLYHGLELLQQHGLRSLYNYLHGIMVGEKGYGRTRSELQRDSRFRDLMDTLCAKFQPIRPAVPHTQQTPGERESTTSLAAGHPKMAKLEELVLEHFHQFQNDHGDTPTSTRIMIFSQYRDSVSEITEMLNQHRPLVKVISFIGQSSINKSSKGFTQKEQIRVMKQFREGGYNTLVSTCVGEEGLDIGDVDLIICFDAHKSPIRLVQRMGRTGRKRKGRIIMLLTEGREEQVYNQSQYNKRSIDRAIANSAKSLVLYPHSQRMVPECFTPFCHKLHMTVAEKVQKVGKTRPNKTKVATERRHHMTTVDKTNMSRGFLTTEEQTYWAENLQVDTREVPLMPPSFMLTLKSLRQGASPEKLNVLSLDRYTPWQNTLQKTRQLGHSQRSQNLVDLMQFIEIMGIAGESGADMYDTEMKSYLCNEDVILTKRKKGLDAFLQPTEPGTKRKRNNEDVAGPSRKIYKSYMLPGFSSSEDDLATDDESDLPDFSTMISSKSGDKQSKKKARSRKTIHPVDTRKQSALPEKCVKTAKEKKKTTSKCSASASNDRTSGPKLFTTVSPARPLSSDLLCVEEDNSSHHPVGQTESPKVDIIFESEEDVEDKMMDLEKDEDNSDDHDPPGHASSSRDCNSWLSNLQSHDHVKSAANGDNTNDLFPFYASAESLPGVADCSQGQSRCIVGSVQGHSWCNIGSVPEPPSEEELAAVMQELDAKRCISPVDILMLIDGWEKEKRLVEVSRGIGFKNKKDVSSPTSDLLCSGKSVRKAPKMSVSTQGVGITAPFSEDSPGHVGTGQTMSRGLDEPERSDRVHQLPPMNESHDERHLNKTQGKYESENIVSDVKYAKQKQDCDMTSVIEDRSRHRQENDMFNEAVRPDSGLKCGLPTENQELSKAHPSPGCNSEKSGTSEKNINANVYSESHGNTSPVPLAQSTVASWADCYSDLDTNMDICLDTSHLSFTQALASVDDSFVSPSPNGKIVKPSINLKPPARCLFKSPKGKSVKTPNEHVFKSPLAKGMRDTDMGIKSPRLGISKAAATWSGSPTGRVSESNVSNRAVELHETPQRNTELSPNREFVSPTLFDEDSDKTTDDCIETPRNVIIKTTSADDLDLPNFSLFDEEDSPEDAESCFKTTGKDPVKMVTSANVLDLPNFNLLDDDSFDELDFDLGFDMAESDEDMIPGDDSHCHDNGAGEQPRTEGGATCVTSSQHHDTAVSSGHVSVSPSECVINAIKLHTNLPVKFKSDINRSDTAKLIVPPTFVSKPLATTSMYDPLDSRNQKDQSVLTHTETHARPGMDDSAMFSNSCDRSVGSRLRLNLKQSHNVRFTETSEQPSERGRSVQQPVFRGKSLREVAFRERTMEERAVRRNSQKQTELGCGRSLTVSSFAANKTTKPWVKIHPSKSTNVSNPDASWTGRKTGHRDDDFIKPQNVMRTLHQNKKTFSKDAAVKPSKIKGKPRNNWFLDEEAEVSGSGDESGDEDDANFDLMEASFIDDATQLSQTQAQGIDSRAMYLQSVRSPGWRGPMGARYKLSYRSHTDDQNVFSQEQMEESCYLQDSFCVDSDDLEEFGSGAEVTQIESAEDDLFTPPRGRRHLSEATTSVNDGSTVKRKKRKRIVQLASSSDEDCQDDKTCRNRPSMMTLNSSVVDKSQSCVKKTGNRSVLDGDMHPCKTKFTTCNSSVYKSQPAMTTSGCPWTGQNWNDDFETQLPLMSHGNMSDKGITSHTPNVHSDAGNQGSHHLTTSHVTAKHMTASHVIAADQQKVSCDSRMSAASNHSMVSTGLPEKRGKLVVFVDSREVNCAQDLMSSLRLKHDLHPIVRQLESCDYIVSARMAVERKLLSDFTNGTNKPKLIDRIQSLCQTYERPCLIVETDRRGRHSDQTIHKPLLKSREVERMLAALAQSHVKILFSESQDETADLLSELCRSEDKKSVALRLERTSLVTGQEQVLEFYLSLPKMTSAAAVSALSSYNTLSRFLHSSPASVSRNSLVSQSKAEEIRKFVKHKFDIQMTPCKKLARTGLNLNNSR